jgi:hypothetical protein
MLVPTALIGNAGAFDESFMGWGGEDVELSLRLYASGARFRVLREPKALHWPHPAEARQEKLDTMIANMLKIFQKHPCLETEVFCAIGHFAGSLVHRLETLPLACVVPEYEPDVLAALNGELAAVKESLLLGAPVHMAKVLPVTYLLSPSARDEAGLRRALGDRQIWRRLGLRLPWSGGALDLAVVTDFFGGLPGAIQLAAVTELRRVCRRTLFICSGEPRTKAQGAFAWSNTGEALLNRLIQLAKGRVVKVTTVGSRRLIEMDGARQRAEVT